MANVHRQQDTQCSGGFPSDVPLGALKNLRVVANKSAQAKGRACRDPGVVALIHLCHDFLMQLDHVSYAVSVDKIADTTQRIGAALGAAFSDGGRHPHFGTRNFILPLAGGSYIEVVAPLDHPAADTRPFGQAVRAVADNGGGWVGWAVRLDSLAPIEARLGRDSVTGHRVRPDGYDLRWHQIGINDLIADPQLPYFISWDDMAQHPSVGFQHPIKITELAISGNQSRVIEWLGDSGEAFVDSVNLAWPTDEEPGLVEVTFQTDKGEVRIS